MACARTQIRALVLPMFMAATLAAPVTIRADDLGEALAFIDEAVPGLVEEVEGASEADDDDALPMLNSRDVEPGRSLDSYDCRDSTIDGEWVLKNNSDVRTIDRWCRERMWKRGEIRGYETLGTKRFKPRELDSLFRSAERETGVPVVIIDAIVRFESGYRPGVIKKTGERGLMQLRPAIVREMNVKNSLDPTENVYAGARYLAKMLDRYGGLLEPALAAFKLGPKPVEAAGRRVPDDRETLWFVREVRRLYKASIDPFPARQGIEDLVYVLTWTDH